MNIIKRIKDYKYYLKTTDGIVNVHNRQSEGLKFCLDLFKLLIPTFLIMATMIWIHYDSNHQAELQVIMLVN